MKVAIVSDFSEVLILSTSVEPQDYEIDDAYYARYLAICTEFDALQSELNALWRGAELIGPDSPD